MLDDIVREQLRSEILQIEDLFVEFSELAFRHFFRQAYAYVLRWEEMRDLVNGLASTWAQTKTELETWLEN